MKFLNCNYPDKYLIVPGKPKCLKKATFSMTYNKSTLIEEKQGTVWFKIDRSHYYGIELDLKHNSMKIDRFATVGAINIAMINWTGEELFNDDKELLYKYLKLLD